MGEYAVDQMMRDYKHATGIDADRSDFEREPRTRKARPACKLCGRTFSGPQGVADHTRDKHGVGAKT